MDSHLEIKTQKLHRPTGITIVNEKYKNGLINEIEIKNAYSGLEVNKIFRFENNKEGKWTVYCKLHSDNKIVIANKSNYQFSCGGEWNLFVTNIRYKNKKTLSISDEDENQLDIFINAK